MKNYFKQIYQDAKQMATATKITLLAICLLPGSVLGTLVVYLASVARDTVAKFEVFRALKSFAGESHVDEVHHLAELLFRHSPELWYAECPDCTLFDDMRWRSRSSMSLPLSEFSSLFYTSQSWVYWCPLNKLFQSVLHVFSPID